ncbi:MAG: sulfotransferase [Bacteroidota bacterium]
MKTGRIITSTDFMNRPGWFNSLNYVWRRAQSLGPAPLLKKDELMAAARQTYGLHDFGSDFWDEPLDRLIHSLNHEANLHPIGSFISRKRIINLLGVRLRAENWFRKFPEILEAEVHPPMVIVGLQRTGTTKLHRLLTADPDNRVLRSWEAINPAPFKLHMNGKDRRIQVAKTSEKALRLMTPGFFVIHPVEHSAPEEDILLLDVTFLSTTPEATTHVPSYSQWLEATDQSHAYEYGSKLLRLLQWQQPGKRWVLKSPHHMEFLPLIEKYYGDPHLIWTHREPNECIPSFLSMVCHSRVIFTDDVQIKRVTDHWVRKTTYMLEKGLAYREQVKERGNFTDIMYTDLVKDSMGQLDKIYERYGGIPDPVRRRFELAESENPQGKYGIHEYDLSDFGLNARDLVQKNSAYYALYHKLKGTQL